MDKASRALAERQLAEAPEPYRAFADRVGVPRSTLYHRSRGRPSREAKASKQQYLTPAEEKAVVEFVLRQSALGRPVQIKHVPHLAHIAAQHRSEPQRPQKPPGKNWARALEKRHPELRARRVRALDWNRHETYTYEKICQWFNTIRDVMERQDVLAENVYNMDETGVMLSLLGCIKVLVGKDDRRDYRGAHVKRETVTAIECISADGRSLAPMIIWPATTHRSNWTTFPTPGWHYACSETGYTDSHISLEWLRRAFDPQTRNRAGSRPRVLICDGFGTHETLGVLEYCFASNIILCRLPSHTSHQLQPCDIAVFAPLKAAYRENVERLERAGVETIGKQHFTSLYSAARERAFTAKNIASAWKKAGLFPFDPDEVLRGLAPPTSKSVVMERSKTANTTRELNAAPRTPITPVSVEALAALQEIIIQHDARTLDATSRQNLERHLLKVMKAATAFHTTTSLQQNEIQVLHQANSEAKVRRSTQSLVLGRARVMSYEDLAAARAKRAEKDAAQGTKTNGRRLRAPVPIFEGFSSTDDIRFRTEDLSSIDVSGEEVACEAQDVTEATPRAPVAYMY